MIKLVDYLCTFIKTLTCVMTLKHTVPFSLLSAPDIFLKAQMQSLPPLNYRGLSIYPDTNSNGANIFIDWFVNRSN